MGAMVSQITSLTIVNSTVHSGAGLRKHQSSVSLTFAGNSPVIGEFPAQMASNAENVSIWWRHHDWGRVSIDAQVEWVSIGSANVLVPVRGQANTWTNAD